VLKILGNKYNKYSFRAIAGLVCVFVGLIALAGFQVKINGSRTVEGTINYAADAGSTDAYAITLSPALTAYTTGACYSFKANTANTGAGSININGLGAKTIKKAAGGVSTDLADNHIRAGQVVNICYDGTNMQMQSATGNVSSGDGGVGTATDGQLLRNSSGSVVGATISTGLSVSGSNITVNTSTVSPMPLIGTAVIDFPSISAQACNEQAITVAGANAGQFAKVQLPAGFTYALVESARVSATDTAQIKLCNPTSSAIDPASATYSVWVSMSSWVVGTIYDVGPGLPYTSISAVPWDSLVPGDEVRIHYNGTTGYREKWHIGKSGTNTAPIRVVGVRGPLNERPIINGQNAVAKLGQNYWNEDRGLIKIGGPSIGSSVIRNVEIEGLELRNARLGNSYTAINGNPWPFANNAAGVYVEGPAQFIKIRDCYITNNGDGIFFGFTNFSTVEGNWVHVNGYQGSSQEHNSYTEGIYNTFQFNRYEQSENWEGNNLKDRGAWTVVRYNQLIDGNRAFDLVNGANQVTYNFPPDYVYGNVIIKRRGYNNNQAMHYGWDTNSTQARRQLYFYHNTVIVTRESPGEGQWVGIKLDNASTLAYAYNNAFWHYSPTGQINAYYGGDLATGPGLMTFVNNWIYQGNCSNPSFGCTRAGSGYVDGGGNIWAGSANPYLNQTTGVITNALSPLIGTATSIPSSFPGGALSFPIRAQYPIGTLRTDINEIGALAY